MKKRTIILLTLLGVILLIMGIILLKKNDIILKEKSKLQIIDATFSCAQNKEKFYEDDKYIYYFPCVKSNSIYVKFENGNKILIKDALNGEKVTIDELIEAGLEVYKENK